MSKRRHYVWLMVTKDEFELPIYSADTAKELAQIVGRKVSTIKRGAFYAENGGKKSRYRRVVIDDSDNT